MNREPKIIFAAWSAVITVTALRAVFAFTLPLTGDEAYYWEWSRRLAAGYIDHPPAVAFVIAAFSWLGRSTIAVRLAFVLCGFGAAIFAAGTAAALTRNRTSAALAALAVSLAPIASVAFGIATPDGPYALAWAATLCFAALAFREHGTLWFALLGAAMGAALLSRFFGFALVAGVAAAALAPQYRTAWRRGLWMSFVVAIIAYAPFVWWNAEHRWISFAFAILQRHPAEIDVARPLVLYLLAALAFSPGIWIGASLAALRCKEPLVTWTVVPLSAVLFVLSLHERVEAYWFFGPFISLCVALGIARMRAALIWAPAAALSALVFAAAIAPRQMYAVLQQAGLHLSDAGPFEMFTYNPLARDVRRITRGRDAIAITDGYGFSSVLDFYGGLEPVVVGYDAQGAEAREWFSDSNHPARALFVDKVPLDSRADFSAQFTRACGVVSPGPILTYGYRRYFTTWCDRMHPHGVATLRWQTTKS